MELLSILLVGEDAHSDSIKVYRSCYKSALFSVTLALLYCVLAVQQILLHRKKKHNTSVYYSMRMSQGSSFGGRETAHIVTAHYIKYCCALQQCLGHMNTGMSTFSPSCCVPFACVGAYSSGRARLISIPGID